MSLKRKDALAHASGKALQGHIDCAHEGKISSECPACLDLLAKREKFQKVENFPIPKPMRRGYQSLLDKGRNPSGHCERGSHARCSGRHARNHGVPGERCSCECHLTEGAE